MTVSSGIRPYAYEREAFTLQVNEKIGFSGVLFEEPMFVITAEKAIYVSGGATYFDVFGKEWETKYRLMHTGPWGGTKGLHVSPEGNEAT